MSKQRLYSILTKYQNNTCSEDELAELELWYQSLDTGNQSIGQAVAEPFADEMLLQFRQKLATEKLTIPFYKRYFNRIAVAASIILLLGISSYLIFFNKGKQNEIVKNTTNPVSNDVIAPTGTKAMITLSDGRQVTLDSITKGTVAVQGNVNVIKTADGQIVYNGSASAVEYNTLFNPRGSQVQPLTLSDGTKVWLNSESSIKYPTAFAGNERRVEITGEAYFEVVHDATKAFYVIKDDVSVQVLGTHFNVNTYSDENNIKVTLLEGAVKVSKDAAIGLLKPGQQAQVGMDVKIVNGIDLNAVMAWKNGYFVFNNTDVKVLMQQIARWYDVDVQYESRVPTLRFGGEVPRNTNLSELMEILKTSGVRFMIEGRKVTIKP